MTDGMEKFLSGKKYLLLSHTHAKRKTTPPVSLQGRAVTRSKVPGPAGLRGCAPALRGNGPQLQGAETGGSP